MNFLLWLLGILMAIVLGTPAATAVVEQSQQHPDFGCYRIITTPINDYTVKVESDAIFTDGVTVVDRTYHFGDGTTVTTAEGYGGPVTHTYAEAGDYRINAVIRFNVDGHEILATGSNCTTSFTAGQE